MIGGLQDGDSVLLHGGGGGVNTAAVHLCNALAKNARVIVTASSGKLERVKALDVDHVIDYTSQDFAEEVSRYTAKQGVQVILDHVGAAYLASNMKSLAVGGRLVVIGVTSGIKAELNLALMMVKRQQIIGSVLRSRAVSEKAAIVVGFSKVVLPLLAQREIVPLVYKVYAMDEVAQAHQDMETSAHFGKIVLSVQGEG
jgi:NADPH:quinone reductase-like Zn-dependent oxidoreductase